MVNYYDSMIKDLRYYLSVRCFYLQEDDIRLADVKGSEDGDTAGNDTNRNNKF